MDERTLTALKASIKHWEENVAAEAPDDAKTGPDHCALCSQFYWDGNRCAGCPVAERVGKPTCRNPEYDKAVGAFMSWSKGKGTREEWRAAAQKELDFLKSLLPEGERA